MNPRYKPRWKPRSKPQPFWWAHESNAKSALIAMGEDLAAIFTMGEGKEACYCAAKRTEKGMRFYCDNGKWHLDWQMENAPEIEKAVRRS